MGQCYKQPKSSAEGKVSVEPTRLKPKVGPMLLTFYGLGTTVGAGIYALIGEVAITAGYFAPFAFLLSAIIAGLSAASFAELSQRLPKAAAAALYVETGFGSKKFALFIGLITALAGLVSSAALVNAFYGYFVEFYPAPRSLVIVGSTVLVTAIAIWGVRESLRVAAVVTTIEILGLLLVISANYDAPAQYPELLSSVSLDGSSGLSIILAAVLAFYAYIGFEDMVDLSEEVKDVHRSMPLAIGVTLGITTLLYFTLSLVAITAVPLEELVSNSAPMALLYAKGGGNPAVISVVALFAIINGVLVQIIMASRVFYGLAVRQNFFKALAQVNPATNTPIRATLLSGLCVIVLSLAAELGELATITAALVLGVFAAVNLALWKIKKRERLNNVKRGIPASLSILGFVFCLGLLAVQAVDFIR
jgi:APA family basic amino acid/polyamine antiporter